MFIPEGTFRLKGVVMLYPSMAFIILLLVTGTSASEEWGTSWRDSLHATLEPGAAVVISNLNGDISLEGWDSGEVFIRYSLRDPAGDPADVQVMCDSSDGLVCTVNGYRGTRIGPGPVVDFLVRVPEDLDLQIVTGTFMGDIRMSSVQGSSLVEIIDGTAYLDGIDGRLAVNVVSGDIHLTDSPGLRNVNIVKGYLNVVIDEIVDDIDITSVEGFVDLEIPEGVLVAASTLSGELDIPGALIVDELVGRSAVAGSGSYTVNIESYSGSIRVRWR